MSHETLSDILAIGETTNVEFKRCGQQPELVEGTVFIALVPIY